MYLNADFITVKNAVNRFIRDGVLTSQDDYFNLCDIGHEPSSDRADVFRLSMTEQPKLGNDTRAVWCVGLSAIVAEHAVMPRERGLTVMKLLAVKGIVHADRAAFDDWVTLQVGFQAMGLAIRETTAWSLPLEWQLAAIEREMADGKKPHIPDKAEFTRRLVADPLGDGEESGGWFFYQCFAGDEPGDSVDDAKSVVERIWQRYVRASSPIVEDIQSMYAEHPEFIDEEWDDFSEVTERWLGQFREIQRLKDYSIEEATAMYFAEQDASGSGQTESLVAPKQKGGRPRYPENDWAYEQVRVKGRKAEAVYPEWLVRAGARAKTLADPRDSFNKAIQAKAGKK